MEYELFEPRLYKGWLIYVETNLSGDTAMLKSQPYTVNTKKKHSQVLKSGHTVDLYKKRTDVNKELRNDMQNMRMMIDQLIGESGS